MREKILISTGGSGGHVIPASIIQEHLNDLLDDDNYDTQVRKKFYNYKVTGRYESN